MRIGLLPTGKYAIIDGNSTVLCQCNRLTDAACVLEYLTLTPMSALEKSIARQAVFNWDNEVKAKAEAKARKKAKQKAKKKLPEPETAAAEPVEEVKKDPAETDIEVPDLPEP